MRTRTATVITLALFVMIVSLPLCDVSEADTAGDVTWYCDGDISIHANQTKTVTVSVYNNNENDPLHIMLSTNSIDHVTIGISEPDFELKPKGATGEADRNYVTVTMSTSKYANNLDTELVISILIYNMTTGDTVTSQQSVAVSVHSSYADGDAMGKILGLFDNPLPEPFDNAIYAALLTLAIWILISAATSSLVRILCDHAVRWVSGLNSKKRLIDTSSFKKMWKYVFAIVLMYGLENCMVIMGIDDTIIGSFKDVTDFITILFIGMVAWHIFTTLANVLSDRLTDGDEESSLKPLILLLGRIVILVAMFFGILYVSGIDPASLAIAVSLAAAGISFGAKTVITQFFCGLQIMIVRTFRSGDKIKVGSDPTTLIVKEIGIMTTKCKNWSNEEIYYVPNSTMSDAKVVNITKDNVYYKVYDYYTIDHRADINLARSVMVEVAYGDEGVVADGSFSKPDVRFNTVNTNEVSLRLAYTVVDHEDYGVISARIRKRIIERFREEGIDIPYPQYTVNVIGPMDEQQTRDLDASGA